MKKKMVVVLSVLLLVCMAFPVGVLAQVTDEPQLQPEALGAAVPAEYLYYICGPIVATKELVTPTYTATYIKDGYWYSGALNLMELATNFSAPYTYYGIYEGWVYQRGPLSP